MSDEELLGGGHCFCSLAGLGVVAGLGGAVGLGVIGGLFTAGCGGAVLSLGTGLRLLVTGGFGGAEGGVGLGAKLTVGSTAGL